jgi:hypothetical protein
LQESSSSPGGRTDGEEDPSYFFGAEDGISCPVIDTLLPCEYGLACPSIEVKLGRHDIIYIESLVFPPQVRENSIVNIPLWSTGYPYLSTTTAPIRN